MRGETESGESREETEAGDAALLERLRRQDDEAYAELIDRYHSSLVRMARIYVGKTDIAEEVVQDTWLAVVKGIDRFAGRSTLKTWIFSILLNRARSRARSEIRSIPFADLVARDVASDERSVEPERFLSEHHPDWPGHWASRPAPWTEDAEGSLLRKEMLEVVEETLSTLPETYRQIVLMRDVFGLSSSEACNALQISETNQRVLLHRARARVRAALEEHMRKGDG